MRILEVIQRMKEHSASEWLGRKIEDDSTRDQVLFGNANDECTGIVVCIYPSIEVIRRAIELGCNFIVTHEALFWNHGDHTDWLRGNAAYEAKRGLLEGGGICVWRNHDHIHAGVMVDGVLRDGIFYGVASKLGWVECMTDPGERMPQSFDLPGMSARALGQALMDAFDLDGLRFIGNADAHIKRVAFPMHIMGRSQADNDLITRMDDQDINALITMEMVDFTVCEYVRDAAALGCPRCIFSIGHFNFEQLGMAWYADYLADGLSGSVPVCFVPINDMYRHMLPFGEYSKGLLK